MQQPNTKEAETKDSRPNWNQSAYSHVWSCTHTHTQAYTTTSCALLHRLKYSTIPTAANLWTRLCRLWPTFPEFQKRNEERTVKEEALYSSLNNSAHMLLKVPYFFSWLDFCHIFRTVTGSQKLCISTWNRWKHLESLVSAGRHTCRSPWPDANNQRDKSPAATCGSKAHSVRESTSTNLRISKSCSADGQLFSSFTDLFWECL